MKNPVKKNLLVAVLAIVCSINFLYAQDTIILNNSMIVGTPKIRQQNKGFFLNNGLKILLVSYL